VSPSDRPADSSAETAGNSLLPPDYWDDYWRAVTIPAEIKKGESLYIDAITDVFDQFCDLGRRQSVLEVGGAPGRYAAYVWRRFGHDMTVIDSSSVGCEKTRENFRLLGTPAQVIRGDVLTDAPACRFDIVYSLGLIEHASSARGMDDLVAGHLRYLRPGGLLIIGCPSYLGLNRLIARRLTPALLAEHNLDAMRLATWTRIEQAQGLTRLRRGYVGGFEPRMLARRERERFGDRAATRLLRYAGALLDSRKLKLLRKLNCSAWSGFLICVYRSATAEDEAPSAAGEAARRAGYDAPESNGMNAPKPSEIS